MYTNFNRLMARIIAHKENIHFFQVDLTIDFHSVIYLLDSFCAWKCYKILLRGYVVRLFSITNCTQQHN